MNFEKNYCEKIMRHFFSVLENPLLIAIHTIGLAAFFLFLIGLFSPPYFTSAAVLVATDAILYNAYQNGVENKRKNSRYNLDEYKKSLEMILAYLQSSIVSSEADPSEKRRISWVTAGAIADKLSVIENNITEELDKTFLAIYQRNFAHQLGDFLYDKKSTYFYGVDNASNLEEAALRCQLNQGKVMSGEIPQTRTFYIDEIQIFKILKLTDSIWKQEANCSITDGEQLQMPVLMFNYPQLYQYIKDKRSRRCIFDDIEKCYLWKKDTHPLNN